MDDPWKCIDQRVTSSSTFNSDCRSFEDNFDSVAPSLVSSTSPDILARKSTKLFEPLPDSSTYLATLGIVCSNVSYFSTLDYAFIPRKKALQADI